MGQGQVPEFFQPWHHPNNVPCQPGMKNCGGCGGSGLKGGNYEVDCSYCNGKGRTLEADDGNDLASVRQAPTRQLRNPGVSFQSPSPPKVFELNALGKFLLFVFKAGLVFLALNLFLRISVVNQVVNNVQIWFANSGANETLKKIPVWYASVTPFPARSIDYPPVKGDWTGRVKCGKKKVEARLMLNGPVSDRVQAQFQLSRDGEPRASKKTLDLVGHLENNKLQFEGGRAFGVEGYYAVQTTIEFINYRPTTATGVLSAPGCDAVRFVLNRT